MNTLNLKKKFEKLKKKFLKKQYNEVIEECILILRNNNIDVMISSSLSVVWLIARYGSS